ncbi:MAG: AAA family ATPase [Bacilli bacterium]|nr:AAA family ATPase [Bacilli bacterium]
MVIHRERYLNDLNARRNDGLIKVVTGIRRCGKSFLLFRLFRDYLLKEGVDG